MFKTLKILIKNISISYKYSQDSKFIQVLFFLMGCIDKYKMPCQNQSLPKITHTTERSTAPNN